MKSLILLLVAIASSFSWASGCEPCCIRVNHIGPEDGHVNTIVIVVNKSRDVDCWKTGAFDTVTPVGEFLFFYIHKYITEAKKREGWPKSKGDVVDEVGAFEIEEVRSGGEIEDVAWMLTAEQSRRLFIDLSIVTKKREPSANLARELDRRVEMINAELKTKAEHKSRA